jgi:glycosyltransferase involved in cell wall biosynthesis
MTQATTVVIPALDEEEAIARVIAEIPRGSCHQIIVVDNGSRDDTAGAARAAGAEVVSEPRRGYGRACLSGLERLRADTEVVVFLDGDHSDYPEELPLLTGPIYAGRADLVLGSRLLRRENLQFLPAHQVWGNRLALALLRRIYDRSFSDFGPFRAIRRGALERLRLTASTWGWNVEMQIRAIEAGLRVEEVAVRYRARVGRSKISGTLLGSIRAGTRILLTILACRTLHGRARGGRPAAL